MYFKSIELENVGPIDHLKIEFPLNTDESPQPIILVGENGSGKSILLSHLVNAMLVSKQEFFDDVEVEKGKVYKFRSSNYIKSGNDYSFSSVNYSDDLHVQEWELLMSKESFEKSLNYTPARKEWSQIPTQDSTHFTTTFQNRINDIKKITKEQCNLYFPVNRYEDPAWLNYNNLTEKARYSNLKNIRDFSNRNIICTSPLKLNRNWLLDLIFDRNSFELQTAPLPLKTNGQENATTSVNILTGYSGQSTTIYEAILEILKILLRESGSIRFGIGTRKNRQISIIRNEQPWIPNIFQLSTGETQLLNLFLSILRDYDLSNSEFNELSDLKGIVIIDEIDAHLHIAHQKELLPKLIKLFPKIQFIISTHSPLFLLGMEEIIGENSFKIINLPDAEVISPSDFSEFINAHNVLKETKKYRSDIKSELERLSKPILFVEGDYDIRYLIKAAELLGKKDLIDKIEIKDAVGYGNLDKIWRSYNNSVSDIIPNKIILLYDCDTNKQNSEKNKVYKRIIPLLVDSPINAGIENLFSSATVSKIETDNPQFIDVKPRSTYRVRGKNIEQKESKLINKNEKRNLCHWLCENGNRDDFANFNSIFDIIAGIINS